MTRPASESRGDGSDPRSLPSRAAEVRDRITRSVFLRDVGSLWTAQVVAIVAGGVQGVLIARWLGPVQYGLGALVIAFPSLVFVFLDARASDAGMKFMGEFHSQGDAERARAFCALGMGLDLAAALATLGVVAILATWAAHNVVHSTTATGLLIGYAAAMVIRAPASTAEASLVTLGRFRAVSAIQAALSIVKAAVSIAAVVASPNVAGIVWGTAAGLVIEGIVMLVAASLFVRPQWGAWWGAHLSTLTDRRREIARFVIWADVSSLLGVAAKQADVVFVGVFAGAAAAGFYRVAINLGQLFGSVVGPLQTVVYQRFSRLRGTSSPEALAGAVRRFALWVAAPLAALGAAAIPLAPLAVRLTVGPRFAPAGGMAQVMVLLGATWVLFLWVRPLAFTLGEVRLWALAGLAVAIFSLGGFAVAVPAFGGLGAAWVRYIASIGAQLFPFAVIRRRYARGRYAWRRVSTNANTA